MLWGDGFEVETLINVRIAKAGLRVTEVPSFETVRHFGVSNLNAFSDGLRVLRTIRAGILPLCTGDTSKLRFGGLKPQVKPEPSPVRAPPNLAERDRSGDVPAMKQLGPMRSARFDASRLSQQHFSALGAQASEFSAGTQALPFRKPDPRHESRPSASVADPTSLSAGTPATFSCSHEFCMRRKTVHPIRLFSAAGRLYLSGLLLTRTQ